MACEKVKPMTAMKSNSTRPALAVSLFCVILGTAHAGSPAAGMQAYKLNGSSAWIAAPAQSLLAYSEAVQRNTGQAVSYIAGYTRNSDQDLSKPPLILVTTSEGRFSLEQVAQLKKISEKEFQAGFEKKAADKGVKLPPIQAGPMVFEPARRIIWQESIANPPSGKLHVVTAMMLTNEGTLNFTLYVSPAERALRLGEFKAFMKQVEIDPRIAYATTTNEAVAAAFSESDASRERRHGRTLGKFVLLLLAGGLFLAYKAAEFGIRKLRAR